MNLKIYESRKNYLVGCWSNRIVIAKLNFITRAAKLALRDRNRTVLCLAPSAGRSLTIVTSLPYQPSTMNEQRLEAYL